MDHKITAVAVVFGLAFGLSASGCGRALSRLGIGAQNLKAPKGAQRVLGIAFHKSADATIKDVVFVMNDCTVVAREYKDISPFEGEVRIVSHDGRPFMQSGCTPITK